MAINNMAKIRASQIRRARVEYYMKLGGYPRPIAEQIFDAIGEKHRLAAKLPQKGELWARDFTLAQNQDYWHYVNAKKEGRL